MKVSIVTATYNLITNGRETLFRQMVASVKRQTYKNIEHIVIDGGSTDGTVALLEEMAVSGLIRYISEPDSGIYDAMNKGVALANGELITFLNSDDFFHEAKGLENSVNLFFDDVDYTYASVRVLDNDKVLKNAGKVKWMRLLRNMPFPHPGMVVRKSVFDKLGGFDTSFKLVADYDFILRLLMAGHKGKRALEFATFRSGGATDVYADIHKTEIARVYEKNYAPVLKTTTANWSQVADDYIFPSELLRNLWNGKYQPMIKISVLYIYLNSLKRRWKERLKK